MIKAHLPTNSLLTRLRFRALAAAGDAVGAADEWVRRVGAITPDSRRAQRFGGLGARSLVGFPLDGLVNPHAITIGEDSLICANSVLSAGWGPDQPDLAPDTLSIGDRVLIGRGSALTAHRSIVIEDDVWTGHHVFVTDMNHGYDDPDRPISQQFMGEFPVRVGAGSWLGFGVAVLPGVTIGRHVVVGANSVVTDDIPDFAVAVGAPARVVKDQRLAGSTRNLTLRQIRA